MNNSFKSINPYNNALIEEYPGFELKQLDPVLGKAASAQKHWQALGLEQRCNLLSTLADTLRQQAETLAVLATREMGKTLASSKAEVEKCAWVCDYYAEHALTFLANQHKESDYSRSYISFQPLGVLLAVMPWNFPYWQVFRFLAPALAVGNAAFLKHARNVSGCALAIEQVLLDAGFPEGLFRTLLINSADMEQVIRHPQIQGVTFTGSTGAGSKIAAAAGSAIKKTVMELGGSDPYIVLADADLEKAVQTCTASRLINNGQSCIAAKRFIVHQDIHDDFVAGMARQMESKKTGDPMMEGTDLGPLARPDLVEQLDEQVQRSLQQGAVLETGGKRDGNFYQPTVLSGIKPGMTAFDEELFGPVAAVIQADSTQQAIALANQSEFGLGAAVFTGNVEEGERIAREQLQAGACFVNAFVASDPRLPFGGIKASGYGRELGELGIHEFCNAKTVVVA